MASGCYVVIMLPTPNGELSQFEFQFVPTYIIASPHCHKISSERSEGTSEMSYKVRHQIFCFRYECINGSQIKPP
jgi:hypothetical protein